MDKNFILVTLTGLLWLSGVSAEEVYQGTDDDGTPTFSDVPQKNSEKLKLRPMNVLPSTKSMDFEFRLNKVPKAAFKYQALDIISPLSDSTVYINNDNLSIKLNVVPAVRSNLGHKLQILFDGEVLAENTTSYTLDRAERGSHNVSARIIDKNKKVLLRSASVAVHIKKPIAR